MKRLQFFITMAIGQISLIISLLRRITPQTDKTRKNIVALKAASAALSEIDESEESESSTPPVNRTLL